MNVIPVVASEIVSQYQRITMAGTNSTGNASATNNNNNNNNTTMTSSSATATATAADANANVKDKNMSAAVTTNVAALLVRLWLLGSPQLDAAGNVGETVTAIEEMVAGILAYLCRCSTPNLSTVLLEAGAEALRGALRRKHRSEEVKQEAVAMRLADAVMEKSNAAPEEVLSDMTLFILHRYGQLSTDVAGAANAAVHRETAAVLASALPRSQVSSFLRQEFAERQRQLEELRRIVWGIRIFNKEEGKTAGLGIEAVHALLEEPLAATGDTLARELQRIEERLQRTLAVLLAPTGTLPPAEMQRLREEYHHCLMCMHVLLSARVMLQTLAARVNLFMLPKYDAALAELRVLFGRPSADPAGLPQPQGQQEEQQQQQQEGGGGAGGEKKKETVPKRLAYPKFVTLAEAYEHACKAVTEFEEIDALIALAVKSEGSYTSQLPERMADDAVRSLASQEAAAAAASAPAALRKEMEERIKGASLGDFTLRYTRDMPSTMEPVQADWYPRSLLGLRGFCPVQYVQRGLLLPGRLPSGDADGAAPSPGFLVLDGGSGQWALAQPTWLAFNSEADMRTFASSPLSYVLPVFQRCNRVEPGVTLLQGLLDYLPQELYIAGARTVEPIPAAARVVAAGMSADSGTQTGQRDSYIDRNYRWNEWDLRREALRLANLLNKRTHSTQTAASNFRRDNATQVNPPKEEETQTALDAATQPPRVAQYIKGLRGTATSEVEQVQKTFLY